MKLKTKLAKGAAIVTLVAIWGVITFFVGIEYIKLIAGLLMFISWIIIVVKVIK